MRRILGYWKEIGTVVGVLSASLLLIDRLWPFVSITVAGVAADGRSLRISVENTGVDTVLVSNFRIQAVDPEVTGVLTLGQLAPSSDPNVSHGRQTVVVGISHIIVEGWDLHDPNSATSFFAKYGDKKVRILADATRRRKIKPLTCDVALGQISSFIVNRSSPPEAAE
ncbi:MAG: hypothetical protein AABO58_19340 [Acidobacteriota bacterium]